MIKKIYQEHKCLIHIILVALFMYIVQTIACEIYPFGDKSLIAGDIAGQYIPFWTYFKNCLIGKESILYTFGKLLGGNMIGIWAYYLMSPYNLVFLLFSNKLIVEAIIIVTGLKFISCSITMYMFLKNKVANKFILAILCLSYAFCGYNIVFQMNLMWLDNVILLPLMVLGAEKIVDNNKYKMYVITLALSLIVNFYTGFATAIFTGLYFIYYNLLQKMEIKKLITRFVKFACYSFLGIGLAAFILIPMIVILKTGKGSSFMIDFDTVFTTNFNYIDIVAKLLLGSVNNEQLALGLPNIYTGLLTLLLAEVYFFNKNIPIKNKIFSLLFIVLIVCSFNIKILNLIWHGLKEPVGFPYRYSFVFSFLLIAIACHALREKNKQTVNWKTVIPITIINVIMMIIVMQKQYAFITNSRITISIIIMIFYSIMLILYLKFKNKTYIVLITIVCVLEILANGILSFRQLNHDKREPFVSNMNKYNNLITEVTKEDTTFYRMEKTEKFFLNDSLLFNYNGMGHSSSTFEQTQVEFMKKIGYNWYIYFPSYGYGNTIITDSIFGIKYKLSKEEEKYYTEQKEIDNYKLYKNNYDLSLGYLTEKKVQDVNLNENPFEIQTNLLNSIANTDLEYFNNIEPQNIRIENVRKEGNYYTGKTGESYIELTYDLSQVKEQLYFWITTPYSLDGSALKLYINDQYIDDYLGANKNGIIKLECNSDIMKLKLELNTDETVQLDEFLLKEINLTNFEIAYQKVEKNQLENIEFKNNQLKANIKVPEGKKYLFTTIPYDKDWKALVDGENQEIENSNGFITINLDEGEHEIKLSYMPKSLELGIAITIISILILFIMIVIEKRKNIGEKDEDKRMVKEK